MAINDITGANLQTKAATSAFRDNWDRIFGRKAKPDDCPGCGGLGYRSCGIDGCYCGGSGKVKIANMADMPADFRQEVADGLRSGELQLQGADHDWTEWLADLTLLMQTLAHSEGTSVGRMAEGLGQRLPELRRRLGVEA